MDAKFMFIISKENTSPTNEILLNLFDNHLMYDINPLVPNGNYSYRIIKISFSIKEEIKKKISY